MNKIPLLTADDIECRVQSVVENKKTGAVGAILLLYKDARVDMRILDEVFGSMGWQRSHEVINGNLFCNIEIWDSEKKQWVKKQDVGTESNTEKEKGQASDSFKRAGFNVGIGRELYTAPFTYVTLEDGECYKDMKSGNWRVNAAVKFTVSQISYNDRREITGLTIVDKTGKVRFEMGRRIEAPQKETQRTAPQKEVQRETNAAMQQENIPQKEPFCTKCGGPITDAERRYSQSKFGRELCRKCQ